MADPVTITLLGCGKMGGALLRNWVKKSPFPARYAIVDPVSPPTPLAASVVHKPSVQDAAEMIRSTDILILAVKPQIMEAVCADVAPLLPEESLVLSIAAGRTLASFETIFATTQPVIRAMPNTPASIGKGASVAVANAAVSASQKQHCEELLKCAGTFAWLEDESLLNAVTALSGSGPAYIFYLIEVLTKSGEELGLPRALATSLARQTVIGAAALAEQEPDQSAETLRANVTSPGGTTAAALDILMDGRLQTLFDDALTAAKKRGEELSA